MKNSTKLLSALLLLSFLPVWGEAYQGRKQLCKQSVTKEKYTKLLRQEINKASLSEAYKIEQTEGFEASMKYLLKEGATEVVTRLITKGAGKIIAKVAGATGFGVFLKKIGKNLGKKVGQKMEKEGLNQLEKEAVKKIKKKAKNKIKQGLVQNSEHRVLKETDKKLVQLSSHVKPSRNFKKLSKNYLKQKGFNPHSLKKEFVNDIAKFDIYRDTKTGELILLRKLKGKSIPIRTGEFIN